MRSSIRNLSLAALMGLAVNAHSAQQFVPNGDFSTPAGEAWNRNGADGTVITFETSGGNSGGFGKIDNTSGSWGVLVAEGGTGPSPEMGAVPSTGDGISLTSLGLTAGETYSFNLDMIDFSSTAPMAGMKIESWAGELKLGESGNQTFPTTVAWANYSFEYEIDPNATHLKFVPLLVNQGAVAVGFDNVGYNDVPVDVDPPPVGAFIIPNGDFESGASGWDEADGGDPSADVSYDYPASGGNPDGHGAIDFTSGFYSVMFSSPFSLGSLGLEAGKTYNFSVDMINLDGPGGVGGLKLEFPGATPDNTGDMNPTVIGDGSTWETYVFEVAVPANATTIKFVNLWGGDDTNIGFDNVGGDNTPITVPPLPAGGIPNGDFEIPDGANWGTTQGTPTFPTMEGNPDGHTVIDGTGDFAVLYAFDNVEVTFASLGLNPGDDYIIQLDMMIMSGSNIGGIRLEGPDAYVVEEYPPLIGTGATWETYQIELTVPASPAQAKIGLRPGGGSVVAFDNVGIFIPESEPFVAEIKTGATVSWTAADVNSTYQPQESANNVDWTNLGPAIAGDSLTTVFDEDGSPFYRVEETQMVLQDDLLNGSFVDPDDFDPFCADKWLCLGENIPADLPTRISTDSSDMDGFSMELKVDNVGTNFGQSELQQNIFGVGGTITPGATYEFSFWAKQIRFGISTVQEYRVDWLAAGGGVIGGNPLVGFTGGDNVWEKKTTSGLVAPAGAETALIQIIVKTGGVDSDFGEVRVDDLQLVASAPGSVVILPATASAGVGICWPTEVGKNYQVKCSDDLGSFSDFGPLMEGDGSIFTVGDVIAARKFYVVEETEP